MNKKSKVVKQKKTKTVLKHKPELLPLLLRLLARIYSSDKFSPGICLSHLPKGVTYHSRHVSTPTIKSVFYGSITRFPTHHEQKIVQHAVIGDTPDEVIQKLGEYVSENMELLNKFQQVIHG